MPNSQGPRSLVLQRFKRSCLTTTPLTDVRSDRSFILHLWLLTEGGQRTFRTSAAIFPP